MAFALQVPDAEAALVLFEAAHTEFFYETLRKYFVELEFVDEEEDFWSQISKIDLGPWAKNHIEIKENLHSELNAPFLEAYLNISRELLRLYAFAKYGNDDNRNLTQEDLDYFQFKVRVSEGSSEGDDNLNELLIKLGSLLIGKMSGRHAVVTVLGLALIGGTTWGTVSYLEGRKETRLAEIASADKQADLRAQQYTTSETLNSYKYIVDAMRSQNEVSSRAVESAMKVQSELLKAASKTGQVVIGDTHLEREEAKDLVASKRGKSQKKILQQEMRVVGGNTGDELQTSVIFEDPVSLQQYKINFRDRVVAEKNRKKVFQALEKRELLWVKLSIKEVDGEVRSAELLDVPRRPRTRQAKRVAD